MAAFGLTLAIFIVWSVIGWAVVCFLNGRRNLTRNALLAPVTGASTIMLGIFECNRWGASVRACGPIITVLFVLTAMILIWRLRVPFPGRVLTPFVAVLVAGALLVGYPLLVYGFDWFSYGNDDMVNYALGAKAFLNRGYLDPFDPRLVLETRDISLVQWLPIILTGGRCGSELTLAWVMSLTGLSGHQVFMPVIVALHLVLICAAGALTVQDRNYRVAGFMTCSWVALSSLVTLGTIYQLISQVFGLGLLAGAGTLLLEPIRWEGRASIKRALLAAILCAAIGVAYPEVLPFLVLSFALAHTLALVRRTETVGSLARATAVTVASVLVLWNTFADSVPAFLLHQAGTGLRTTPLADMLFPYYLVPSGLATFWGFLPIGQPLGRPLLDIAVVGGAVLLAAAAVVVLWQAWLARPPAVVAVVMMALAVRLAWMPSDFGLYKLAMYCQPFLIGSILLAFRRGTVRTAVWILPIAIVAALGLRAQVHYVALSAGIGGAKGGFVEVPQASSRGLISRLQVLGREPHRPLVVSDTANVVLAKIQASEFAPARQEYPAQDFFSTPSWAVMRLASWYADLVRPGYVARSREVLLKWRESQRHANFDMHAGQPNRFVLVNGRNPEDRVYSVLVSGSALSVLNRRHANLASADSILTMVNSEELHNHLIQVDSDLGKNYYHSFRAWGEGRVALFQLEPDYFYPGQSMSAAGRTILFEILNPSRRVRLQMEFTASLQSDGRNQIPRARAIGLEPSVFQPAGRGSARLFSAPLEPQIIAGRHYLALDMGVDGRLFSQPRNGVMGLFGASIPLDSRRITGFIRDVSAADAEEYDRLEPPAKISDFPRDLSNKSLEYSGIYEDGWVAEDSFLQLRQPEQESALTVRVAVPRLAHQPERLRVLMDGNTVAETALHPGDNEVQAIVDGPVARRRIDLRFDAATPLPAPDTRKVSAQLKFVGFNDSEKIRTVIARAPIEIRDHWYPFERFQGKSFRWVENDARLVVVAPKPRAGELAIDVEPGPGMGGKPLTLRMTLPDGGVRVLPTIIGRQAIRVPLSLKGGFNSLSLHTEGGSMAIPSDPRKLNFRVFSLVWMPRP